MAKKISEMVASPPTPVKEMEPAGKLCKADAKFLSLALRSDAELRQAAMSPRVPIIVGLAIIGVFFSGVVFWGVMVPLNTSISAPAEVVFKSKRQSVQHLEGGIVKSILVKDGDMVQAGQPLIRLENNQVQPMVQMLEEQNAAEIAFSARVDAESKDLPSIPFPRSLTDRRNDPSVARIIESETRLFSARRVAFQNQVQMLRLQIAEIRESTKGTQERLATKRQEISSIKQQLEANQALQKQGYVTNTVVLDLQRALASYTGEREVLSAAIASDKQRIAEVEQKILALRSERIQSAISEMKQSSMRRIDQQERVRPLRDTLERQVIRAPVTGKVVGLKVSTVGGVILPREQLMEISPVGDHLILEAKIKLEDVSEVKVGQNSEIRISGLNIRNTPSLIAKVTYVSDDRIAGSPGQPAYYAAILEFDQRSLKFAEEHHVKPGMSAQISVGTKPRTPFDYVVDPMHEHMRKALITR